MRRRIEILSLRQEDVQGTWGSVGVARSKSEIYLHIVWATKNREPMLDSEIEPRVFGCITNGVQKLGCVMLAIGGMPDHIHLVVKIPPAVGAAEVVKQAKGASSRLAKEVLQLAQTLYWQEGYAVFSISRSHVKRVVAYVQTQKQHHASDKTWPDWEQTE